MRRRTRRRRFERKPVKAAKPKGPQIKRDENGDMILPRLKGSGYAYLGAEWFGCCGTGARAKILYCKYSDRYLVGRELAFDIEVRLKVIGFKGRILRYGGETLYVFKTRGPAVAKFNELDREVRKFNAEQSEAVKRDSALAAKGDMAAILRMGLDH